jgi:hypothetical protein
MESKKGKKKQYSDSEDSAIDQLASTGFYELNIRVGGTENLDTPFQNLVQDPLVIKNLQEMAISSINGKQDA